MKLSDTKPAPPKILIWGYSGCGKTALSYTFGERARVFDFDRGWEVGRSLVDPFTEARRSVDIAGPVDKAGQPLGYIDTDPMVPRASLIFKQDLMNAARKILEGTYDKEVLIIDNLTTLFDCSMRYAKATGSAKSGNKAMDADIGKLYYGLCFTDVLNMCQLIKSIPITVVVIAHAMPLYVADPQGNQFLDGVKINIAGKGMPEKVNAYFDEVWYMLSQDEGGGKWKRKIQTQPDTKKSCKTRYQVLNMTDTSIGLPKILEGVGFKF